MEFEGSFSVPGTPDTVIRRFADVEKMAGCMPGASIEGQDEDGNYLGVMTVAFGPKKIKFRGRVSVDTDFEAHTGKLHGRGAADLRQARIEVRINYTVTPDPEGTEENPQSLVSLKSEADLQGVLAEFARTGGVAVANAVMADFSKRIAAEFAREEGVSNAEAGAESTAGPATPPAPAEALSATNLLWQIVKSKLQALARSLGLSGSRTD